MGLQFDLVGYAPDLPRSWYGRLSGGREPADRVAAQLLGDGARYEGFIGETDLHRSWEPPRVMCAVYGPVVLVLWRGMPDAALEWDRLEVDPTCQRFHLGIYPASDGLEVHWQSPTGESLRHVSIEGGEVMMNTGDAQAFSTTDEGDPNIYVDDGTRLSKATIAKLLEKAKPEDMMTYDGRRYIRTKNKKAILTARISRKDDLTESNGKWWVAIDQKGKVNLHGDPFYDLEDDVEEIADRVSQCWFRTSFLYPDHQDLVGLHSYSWPTAS